MWELGGDVGAPSAEARPHDIGREIPAQERPIGIPARGAPEAYGLFRRIRPEEAPPSAVEASEAGEEAGSVDRRHGSVSGG